MHLKTSSVKWQSFCPGGDELIYEQGHPSIEAATQIAVAFMSFTTASAKVCGITHSIYIYVIFLNFHLANAKSIGINSGPRTTTTVRPLWYTCNRPPADLWCFATDYWPTWHLGATTFELPVWLGKSLQEMKISRVTCDWFRTMPNHIRAPLDLRPKVDPAASWVTRQWNLQVPRPILTVKSGRGACRFQWRVGPSYCEYSGVTYDLLLSIIGGTFDLADQFPSNRQFGPILVVSQSPSPSGVWC